MFTNLNNDLNIYKKTHTSFRYKRVVLKGTSQLLSYKTVTAHFYAHAA